MYRRDVGLRVAKVAVTFKALAEPPALRVRRTDPPSEGPGGSRKIDQNL